ncbi:MAG: methionyl-tRNA formyltransferase [Muribaculum sp.]|nr:methionyl-tRNA formyltransferase [Muribaculaceae bacterium]MCM1081041.1 methionyl-tRNA formyltransferase [Muribaculum sp.]
MEKEKLKIVFFGTPEFAAESLEKIYENGYNIVGVVTMPDKPAGRGHKLLQSPVKGFAGSKGLHLMQPVNLKDLEFVEQLKSLNADLFIVIAFRMLPEVVWTMPPLGTFNLHASLLPNYRGAAPINWAVINGDTKTGVTTFFLKHEIDTGDIIDQQSVDILPNENVGDVHDKLMHLGAELTLKTINRILEGTLKPIPQDQLINDIEPTPAPKIFKDTCRINWEKHAENIHNLVRGLSPYPAAWTVLSDGNNEINIKIFSTSISDPTDAVSGSLLIQKNRLFVACNDKWLEVEQLQASGKRRMTAAEFMRGTDLSSYKAIN